MHYTQSGYSRWNKSLVFGEGGELYVFFKNYEYIPEHIYFEYFDDRGGASYFVSYLFSNDRGDSWSSGSTKKPAAFFPKDLEMVSGESKPNDSNGFHSVGNLLYADGNAYLLFSRTDGKKSAKLNIAKISKKGHEETFKIELTDENYEIVGPAAFSKDASQNFFILATATEKKSYCNCTRDWGRESNILLFAVLDSNFKTIFTKRIDHKFLDKAVAGNKTGNKKGAIWLPAKEYFRSGRAGPTFIFTVGQKGMDNDEIIYNQVYSLKAIPR